MPARSILLVLLLVCSAGFAGNAQRQRRPIPPPLDHIYRYDSTITKHTLKQRHAFPVFKQASQIQLVSFCLTDKLIETEVQGCCDLYEDCFIPVYGDSIAYTQMGQVKNLTLSETDTLTDLLYNNCSRWLVRLETKSPYYRPRNGILFLNEKGKAFAFIELSFDDYAVRYSNTSIQEPDFCSQMLDCLKAFFQRMGVQTEQIDERHPSAITSPDTGSAR